jgi:cell division protein FtsB
MPPLPAEVTEPSPVAQTIISRGLGLTWRVAAIAVVMVVLIASYLQSVIVYVNQQRQITAQQQANAAMQSDIDSMRDEVTRWQDPAYVKAQARERLGWAMPGDIGYIVVDENGNPIASGATITPAGATPDDEQPSTWFDQLWGSVQAADNPAPKEPS